MWKLLVRCTILLLLVFGSLQWVAKQIRETRYDPYGPYRNHLAAIYEPDKTFRALSVGNSHSYSIEFDQLGVDGFHLGLSSGDLFELDHILRSTLPMLPSVEIVFINISYFSYEFDNAADVNARVRRKWLYAATDGWHLIDGDRAAFIMGKLNRWLSLDTIWSTPDSHMARALLGQVNPTAPPKRGEDGHRNRGQYLSCQHEPSYAALTEQAKIPVTSHRSRVEMMQRVNQNLRSDTVETLDALLTDLRAKGIDVILYTPPYFAAYTKRYPQRQSDVMRGLSQEMAARHEALYLDFSTHRDISHNHEFFINADHLNRCGALAFSRILGEQLDLEIAD